MSARKPWTDARGARRTATDFWIDASPGWVSSRKVRRLLREVRDSAEYIARTLEDETASIEHRRLVAGLVRDIAELVKR